MGNICSSKCVFRSLRSLYCSTNSLFFALLSCFFLISLLLSQFEDYVMDICFEVLDNSNDALNNSEMDMERRFDPVYVSRIITAMVTISSTLFLIQY